MLIGAHRLHRNRLQKQPPELRIGAKRTRCGRRVLVNRTVAGGVEHGLLYAAVAQEDMAAPPEEIAADDIHIRVR